MNLPLDLQGPDPLEEFERSIEQTFLSEVDMFADPLCRTLDALEASLENSGPMGLPLSETLHGVLDCTENSVEQQGTLEPVSERLLPVQNGMLDSGFEGEAGKFESEPATEDFEETLAARQHPARIPKMKGRG